MIANGILTFFISIERALLLIPTLFATGCLGCLIVLPFVLPLYLLTVTLMWLPLSRVLVGTSVLWEKIPLLRPLLALIGIPIAIVADMIIGLLPNPDKEDKLVKLAICDSWPFSQRVIRAQQVETAHVDQ